MRKRLLAYRFEVNKDGAFSAAGVHDPIFKEVVKMKKLASVLAAAALVATAATVSFAGGAPGTGVNGSMHDINSVAGYQGDEFQRVCVFCHTPHNALPNGIVPAPLWNHAPSTVQLSAYNWAAPLNNTITFPAVDPLVGPSRLCMACHDGLTAVDSHGSAGQGGNGNTKLQGSVPDAILGVTKKRYIDDLTVTHPIGFLYADAVTERNKDGMVELVTADKGFLLNAGASAVTFDTKTRVGATYSNKKINDTLYNGFFTCASCHEVHNTNNVASVSTNGTVPNYFLWAPEQQSLICLSCHIK
jgi:hypothetical protein